MILNISLTVIDLNIDSSIILDFFILDLLSFRNFSFVGSPELVDVVEQKSGFRWFLSEFLLIFLLLLLIFLLVVLFLLFLLLFNISWHFSIILFFLSLGFLGSLLQLFLHWLHPSYPPSSRLSSPQYLLAFQHHPFPS